MIFFMEINERILYLIDNKTNKNKRKFAEMIGFAPQVISNIVSGRKSNPSYDVIYSILSTFDDINANWLLTGNGSMLKEVAPVQADCTGKVEELEKYNKVLEENCQLWREKAGTLEKELQALKKLKQDTPAVGKL